MELTKKEKEVLCEILGAMRYYDMLAILARADYGGEPDEEDSAISEGRRTLVNIYMKLDRDIKKGDNDVSKD